MKRIESKVSNLTTKVTYEIEPNFEELEQSLNHAVSNEDWDRLSIVLSTLDTLGIIKDFRGYYMAIKQGELTPNEFIEKVRG